MQSCTHLASNYSHSKASWPCRPQLPSLNLDHKDLTCKLHPFHFHNRALVATLAGMALANTGVLPPGAPELHAVYKYVLPLAIPMLLFSADIRWVGVARFASLTAHAFGLLVRGQKAM